MKLHQLLAFEKDVRKRTQATMTEVHRDSANEARMKGVHKTYKPLEEGGVRYPDEGSPVALKAEDAIERFREAWMEEAEIVERKDRANLEARADILVFGGQVVAQGLPATHLLFLEKHLEHVRTFLEKIAVLPEQTNWTYSEQTGLFSSPESMTQRTEKVPEVVTLLQPTKEHPGQAQIVSRDKVVGHWYTTLSHGGLPLERKRLYLARLAQLSDAVKEARERANEASVPAVSDTAASLLQFIFDTE